jgi:hypothetical protein
MIQAANPIPSPADSSRLGPLLARLDEIRRELDRDDVELEDQMTLYREACGHLAAARRMLGEKPKGDPFERRQSTRRDRRHTVSSPSPPIPP